MEFIWSVVLGVASAVVLISNALEKIIKAVKTAKAPSVEIDNRLTTLEVWRKEVDGKLALDNNRLLAIANDNRVTQRALLALLDHGIDGNNIEQMQHAKEELQNSLISK